MKINAEVIAHTALRLLDEGGLDGLTMRVVATELGVRAPTLYWHVKSKQHLLDAMANVMFAESVEGLERPRRDEPWSEWLVAGAHRLRAVLLRYRDGARVFAGTYVTDPSLPRVVKLVLGVLQDAGFSEVDAARGYASILHYIIGYTIEEQARQGAAYGADNPYATTGLAVPADTEAAFEHGVRLLVTGMAAMRTPARTGEASAPTER